MQRVLMRGSIALANSAVLNDADRLAGMIGQTLSLAGRLHPAVKHPEDDPRVALLDNILQIEPGIKTMFQTFDQRRDTAPRLSSRDDP